MTDPLTCVLSDLIRCGGGEDGSRKAQEIVVRKLEKLGFSASYFTTENSRHLFCTRPGERELFIIAGHTDVVPPGDLTKWTSAPFQPEERDGFLYGRGATDMRGAIAAFLAAIELEPDVRGIGLIIAGDEETTAHGTEHVLKELLAQGYSIKAALVGEPSAKEKVGDRIRIGRRGSLTGTIIVEGTQGHVAYPEKARNPIREGSEALTRLQGISWPTPEKPWPKTNLEITHIAAGDGSANVIPGTFKAIFNIRYSPPFNREKLIELCESELKDLPSLSLTWSRGSQLFQPCNPAYLSFIESCVTRVTGLTPEHSVGGGTSDGRFFAAAGIPTIEIGTVAETLHEIDERVEVEGLRTLVAVYREILRSVGKEFFEKK